MGDQHVVLVVSDSGVSWSELKELTHLIEVNDDDLREVKNEISSEGNAVMITTESPSIDDVIYNNSLLTRPSRKAASSNRVLVSSNREENEEVADEYKPETDCSKTKRVKKKPGHTKKKGNVTNETEVKSNGEAYSCEVCSKTFRQKGNLKAHLRVHTDEKPFTCSICKKGMKSKETLMRHQYLHTGEKPYTCPSCSRGFSSSLALKEHEARHKNELLYNCHVCNRGFRHASAYKRHLTVHSDATPFTCEECGKKFSQKAYLRSHLRSHTGERPFGCDKCGKRFAHLSDVTRHKIIHTGTKPFVCKHCGASFSDPSSHRRHEREHVSEKSFQCETCNQHFKRPVQLRNHMAKCHGITSSQTGEIICVEHVNESDVSVMYIQDLANEESKCGASIVTEGDDHIEETEAEKPDYVKNPDFTSQDYYNWLSNFTSKVNSSALPLEGDLFLDVTNVHQALAQVLVRPSKVLTNKKNFQIVLDILKNLQDIITTQLTNVLNTLSDLE